jgi:hypothetical protein
MSVLFALLLGCDPSGDKASGDRPVDGSLCPADVDVFTTQVWDGVLSEHCVACHGPGGVASGSAFALDPDDLAASMAATFAVVDRLVEKPTGTHPSGHGGGEVLAADSAGADALRFWVGWIGGTCEVPEPVSCDEREAPRLLRRLTHAEYARSVADVLGVFVDPASLSSDPVVDGFRNDARALVVTDLLADQYRSSAESIADQVDVADLVACPVASGDAACASAMVEDLGLRLFRRPLTQADVDRYLGLWTEVAADDGFEEGVRWVLVAFLQSPSFLYRSELGVQDGEGTFTLTGWEAATALSFSIWGTTPDAQLLAAAGDGTLDTPDGVAAKATEMLADPRALSTAADLVEVWLDSAPLASVPRDGLSPELRSQMLQETRDLVFDVARADGTLADLMTSRTTFVGPELAAHYGLGETGEVTLDGVRYGGLLTQASVLTTHGRPSGSGPIQRGVLVRERLLCEDLPPPPSNLDVSPPEVDPSLSTREQFAEHAADPACAGCHDRIDPLGFAFEHYDELGRYRDTDGSHPIDDSGSLDGVPLAGPFELADALVADPRFRTCFARTWRRHTTGVDACAEDPGVEVGLLTPLAEVARWPGFRVRTGGPGEGDTLAVGTRIDPETPVEPEVGAGEVSFTFGIVNDWGAGACWDGVVTNTTTGAVTWEVRAPADGTVDNFWNVALEVQGSDWVFRGVEWNAELAPGAEASFGWCTTR